MHVVVTGASSGIGEALVRECLRQGASVTVVARRRELLEKLASGNAKVHVVQADLSDVEHCCDWIEGAEAALGPIDVLVNNAGATLVASTPKVDWSRAERILRLNVLTPLKLTHAVLPGMIRRGHGCIVDVASVAGLVGMPGGFFYNATKGALATASESLRSEMRPKGIHVVTVYPGPIHTAMEEEAYASFASKPLFVPTGTPEKLARLMWSAIQKKKARVIYPWFYTTSRWFAPLARWIADWTVPALKEG